MKIFAPRLWTSAVILGLLSLSSELAFAGMTPAEVRDFTFTKVKAERGEPNGLFNLGVCYSTGRGVPVDPVLALLWWRKSAEKGYAPAMYNLGYCAIRGIGMAEDPVEGVAWYRKSAELGHVPALCNLGICYEDGVGVPVNLPEAAKWLRKAAEQGDAAAAVRLELLKDKLAQPALTVAPTYPRARSGNAFEVYKAKAELGDALAQYLLGNIYFYGTGGSKDPAEALKWYLKAAQQGQVDAQYRLGFIYEQGLGVPVEYFESARWWRRAADQGHAGAQFSLGYCYGRGEGVPRNLAEAAKWFHKSADQGNASAYRFLGVAYDRGLGVGKDKVEAYAYLALAQSGDDYARGYLNNIAQEMSPHTIQMGQQRAQELQKEIEAKIIAKKTGSDERPTVPFAAVKPSSGQPVAPQSAAPLSVDPSDASSPKPSAARTSREDLDAKMGSLFGRRMSEEERAAQKAAGQK